MSVDAMAGGILVVDDHPVNLELMVALLEAHGHRVRTAPDAPQALRRIAEHAPELILMDLQMPGTDGFELTTRLKADRATAHIPVIAVTSHAMSHDRRRALAVGCAAHVSKPIDTRAFPELVARHLPVAAAGPHGGGGRVGPDQSASSPRPPSTAGSVK